jgi:hypothetical protein
MVLQWCSRSREYWEKRTQLSEALPYLKKSTSHCMRIIAEIENQACAGHIPWLSGPSTWLVVLATSYVRGHWTQTLQITWYPKPPSPHTHKCGDKLLCRLWNHFTLACVSQLKLRDTDTRPSNSCDFHSLDSQTRRFTAWQGMKASRPTSSGSCKPVYNRRHSGWSTQTHRLWII